MRIKNRATDGMRIYSFLFIFNIYDSLFFLFDTFLRSAHSSSHIAAYIQVPTAKCAVILLKTRIYSEIYICMYIMCELVQVHHPVVVRMSLSIRAHSYICIMCNVQCLLVTYDRIVSCRAFYVQQARIFQLVGISHWPFKFVRIDFTHLRTIVVNSQQYYIILYYMHPCIHARIACFSDREKGRHLTFSASKEEFQD